MSDDRGTGEQEVPEGVVAVVMGVDDRPNRLRRDRSDRVQVGTGAADGRAGVDADHSALADKKAGVVDPPGPVGLDIGEDAVVDLLQLGRARGRDVVVDGAHVALRCGDTLLKADRLPVASRVARREIPVWQVARSPGSCRTGCSRRR